MRGGPLGSLKLTVSQCYLIFSDVIKGSWEAILPSYGQIEF